MDTCGNVLVSKDALKFALKCLYCEIDYIEEWEAFVAHIQGLHHSEDEEACIDPTVQLDSEENIVIGWVKEEAVTTAAVPSKNCEEYVNNSKAEMTLAEVAKEESERDDPVSDNGRVSDFDEDDVDNGNDDRSSDTDYTEEVVSKDRRTSKKFKPTFVRRNTNTTVFIEIFEKASCLWNPNDKNYGDNTERTNSKKEIIKEMEKRCQVKLTNKTLWESLRELYARYKATVLAIEKLGESKSKKPSAIVMSYFEKCSFLSAARDDFLDVEDEIPNTNSNLSFATLNSTTIAFIETYSRFPSLYDPKHEDYSSVLARKKKYKEMANILRVEHNIEFSDDDIYKGIFYLRHWYFKFKGRNGKESKKQTNLTNTSKFYVEKCSFLPDRKAREKIKCPECDKSFQTRAAKQVHMFKEHKIGELPYKCVECNKSFCSNAALKGHQNRNHMEKIHKCEFCERSFAVMPDLKNHMEMHTGHKPFVCELCGKAFRTKTRMGYHKNAIHIKLRAFKCTMCPKDFLKNRDLKDHIKSHLNIRDKICETCGKGFTNSHALIRHRQLHAEVKKFACKFCEKRFYQFVGLNSHMKHRHGIYKNPQKKTEKKSENVDVPTGSQ